MGITIRSKNKEIDMGYMGFFQLRTDIARHIDITFGRLYTNVTQTHNEKDYEEAWNRIVEYTNTKFNYEKKSEVNRFQRVINFLFYSDCDAKMTAAECRAVLFYIKDMHSDIIYGYAGRPHPAKLEDFIEVLQDGVDSKSGIRWH